jgi:hypothetical protein
MPGSEENVSEVLEEIEKWTDIVDQAKIDTAKWEGKLAEILDRLKTKFGITTLNVAEKQLKKKEELKTKIEKEMISRRNLIREKYSL